MLREQLRMFFSKLAYRLRDENDLSDVTWALCESSPTFSSLFVGFFFADIGSQAMISLTREYVKGDSRPDFYFFLDGRQYIIEVKKYDRNFHFAQYKSAFPPNCRFGWIANYAVGEADRLRAKDIQIRTWNDFKRHLEKSVVKAKKEERELILAYCEYLKTVCSIVDFKKMDLKNLISLFMFSKMIDVIIEKSVDDFDCKLYTQARGTWEDRTGRVFQISRKDTPGKVSYPWFGVYYCENKVCICIGFPKISCKAIHDGVEGMIVGGSVIHSDSFLDPYPEEAAYWFEMRASVFDRFNDLDSPKEQEELLTNFFAETIRAVEKFI